MNRLQVVRVGSAKYISWGAADTFLGVCHLAYLSFLRAVDIKVLRT